MVACGARSAGHRWECWLWAPVGSGCGAASVDEFALARVAARAREAIAPTPRLNCLPTAIGRQVLFGQD